jgi:hypothetical protein
MKTMFLALGAGRPNGSLFSGTCPQPNNNKKNKRKDGMHFMGNRVVCQKIPLGLSPLHPKSIG